MLHWTHAGAVASPTTLQIRVTRRFPGRVQAGAPEPQRSLTDAEVLSNIEHFTVHRRGPRAIPCQAMVLSGVDLDARPALADIVDQARHWGVAHTTLHLGHGDRDRLARSPLGPRVDAVALTVADVADIADIAALRARDQPHVTAVVVLDERSLPRLEMLARGLARVGPHRVVFTWPFPPSAPPPRARQAAAALASALPLLDARGVASGVKGLPACALGSIPVDRLWRSQNRWYVDAGHQLDEALLFFPDVVRFAKTDVCRFCEATDRCDGPPEQWLAEGLAGVLTPMEEPEGRSGG
ncbi:MAG: hypothetical protein JRJ84_12365 [Deltaproteobacteria bacterium]|nr:hypothetical protein [Deltaproteobacteria bacterium]